jgi:hypothetical protein
MPSVSPETSRATKLMLDRLKELSPAPGGGSVEATLLSVPEDRRARVLSVLETLDARAHEAKTDEALGEAARLVRNAARELWAIPNQPDSARALATGRVWGKIPGFLECALFGGQRHAAVLTRRWAC